MQGIYKINLFCHLKLRNRRVFVHFGDEALEGRTTATETATNLVPLVLHRLPVTAHSNISVRHKLLNFCDKDTTFSSFLSIFCLIFVKKHKIKHFLFAQFKKMLYFCPIFVCLYKTKYDNRSQTATIIDEKR